MEKMNLMEKKRIKEFEPLVEFIGQVCEYFGIEDAYHIAEKFPELEEMILTPDIIIETLREFEETENCWAAMIFVQFLFDYVSECYSPVLLQIRENNFTAEIYFHAFLEAMEDEYCEYKEGDF